MKISPDYVPVVSILTGNYKLANAVVATIYNITFYSFETLKFCLRHKTSENYNFNAFLDSSLGTFQLYFRAIIEMIPIIGNYLVYAQEVKAQKLFLDRPGDWEKDYIFASYFSNYILGY